MINLMRIYNKNRKKIWFVLGTCVAIYVIIHSINSFLGQDLYSEENFDIPENKFYDTNYSVVSREKIDIELNRELTNIIKVFIECCNTGKIEDAYNLLSSDCKEVLYPTIEKFKEEYYNKVFNETKTYKLQAWNNNNNKYIYRVELIEDMLSTGTTVNVQKIDYFTVIREGKTLFLNISGFVEKHDINISEENNLAKINIKNEEIFVDYLNLNIEVTNKTDNNILLDSGEEGDTVYIKDTNGIAYASYLFENYNFNLSIRRRSSQDFKIKFLKEYNVDTKLKEVGFLDISRQYEETDKEDRKIVVQLIDEK